MAIAPPDLPAAEPLRIRHNARTQVGFSALTCVLCGIVVGILADWGLAALVAWDVAAAVYMVWVWRHVWPCDANRTAELAVAEDPTRTSADLIILGASLASLVAVGAVLVQAASAHGVDKGLHAGLAVGSVVISWTIVHTVFMLRYTRLYYTGPDGGVDFNDHRPPSYSDFAYLSFTIGMTFQVSDTSLQSSAMRRTALRQALISYVFGAGIVATTINLIAGVGH